MSDKFQLQLLKGRSKLVPTISQQTQQYIDAERLEWEIPNHVNNRPKEEEEPTEIQPITAEKRRLIWDRYVGINLSKAKCKVCGKLDISSTKKGFEAGHIISKQLLGHSDAFYLYPMCGTCNSTCSNACMFDYMYSLQRLGAIQEIAMQIFKTWSDCNPEYNETCWWKLIAHLYAASQNDGKGYTREEEIKALLINYQVQRESEVQMQLLQQMTRSTQIVAELLQEKNKRRKL